MYSRHMKEFYGEIPAYEDRGTGTSTILGLRIIANAIENHGEWVEIKENGRKQTRHLVDHIRDMCGYLHLDYIQFNKSENRMYMRSCHIVGDESCLKK